jgi:hypothetical protein
MLTASLFYLLPIFALLGFSTNGTKKEKKGKEERCVEYYKSLLIEQEPSNIL